MPKNITLMGASFSDVPAVDLPQTGGGTARFIDPSPTTAIDSDVASGKIYYKADGTQSVGTASAGQAIVITDETDSHGGTIRHINGVVVSGTQSITQNGTYNVTEYASVDVNVAGGGGGGMQTDEAVGIPSSTTTLVFTGLKGEPTSFSVMPDGSVSTGTPAKVAAIVYDGTTIHAQTITNTSNAQVTYDSSSFTKSYSNGTLTITSSGPNFVSVEHYLYYTYGGSSANIDTKDVQVGSGATSITFTGLEDEPDIWSVIFKSNFGTSSGYQRVIFARNNSLGVEGMEMDSMARNALHWSASYSNGSFTVTSNGTNQGGYFHQPGYYQLTYGFGAGGGGGGSVLVPKTITENGTYDPADDNADGYSEVTVNVPTGGTPRTSSDLTVSGATVTAPAGTYATAASKSVASGTVTAPTSISGTAATVTTGTNTLTLTKTVSVTPRVTTAGYVTAGTAGNASVSLTGSVTTQAAQTIHPSTSDQTISASRYLTGAQTIKAVTLSNLTADNIKSGVTVKIGDSTDDDCVTSITGSYTGGGGSLSVDTKTVTASNYPVSISFSSMQGEPKYFFLRSTSQISSSGSTTYYYIIDMRYNGTNTTGNCFRIGSTRRVENITSGYSWSYSGTTLTITSRAASRSASPGAFNNTYELTYIY